ncbi:hypothetical protein RA210_U30166 [Rubrivivax sp. A210]|uniref:hypothetical protein n=1 Tax=Rubrivivax sp. A210 TaxID=2772301 RepID=UPI0019190D85|nr:hypothetical protein [Rubrivivax sp. A210]CAD5373254.1 hypothetical protein RA210_U30166 [Rubrivivax sp. A210]
MARELKLSLADLLEEAGYRVEGPGGPRDGVLVGRYWWTLSRDGWSGIECGDDFPSRAEAQADAVESLLADDGLDWAACAVHDFAVDQFPPQFATRMAAVKTQ